jgi:hypothetical protein
LFSDRNPFMRSIGELAEQVRQQRRPAAPDNPFLQVQAAISESIIETLRAWGNLRDQTLEQIFLAIYGSPILQALLGMRATDGTPRPQPSIEPARREFIEGRIVELKARIAEGGAVEGAIRSLFYVGLAGPGVDEREFNQLRLMRDEHRGMTLEEFKQTAREQFFALMLDPEGAVSAIPKMIPDDTNVRAKMLRTIRTVLSASGEISGERAKRLTRIETLWGEPPRRRAERGDHDDPRD